MADDLCDRCGKDADTLVSVHVARATLGSPAEYELRCLDCAGHGRRRALTRHDVLQGLADAGIDTWDDYHGRK